MRFADAAPGVGDSGASGLWADLVSSAVIIRLVELLVIGGLVLVVLLLLVRPFMQRLILQRDVAYLPPMQPVPAVQSLPRQMLATPGAARPALPEPPPMPPVEELVSINLIEGKIQANSVRQVVDLSDRFPDQALAVVRRWLSEYRGAST